MLKTVSSLKPDSEQNLDKTGISNWNECCKNRVDYWHDGKFENLLPFHYETAGFSTAKGGNK